MTKVTRCGILSFQPLLPSTPNSPGQNYACRVNSTQLNLTGGLVAHLPAHLQHPMEKIFSADLSNIRIHQGPQPERINAAAFALGSDIYFAPGQFQSNTAQGLQLLGHELTHVLQQRRGQVPTPASGLTVIQDRELEIEADRMGWIAAGRLHSQGRASSFAQPAWHLHQAAQSFDSVATRQSGTIQPRFYIGQHGCSSLDGNLDAFANKVLPFAATSNLSEVKQTLTRFDFQNRRFKNLVKFLTAMNEEILLDRYEKGDPVPKYLHHFWAGGALSDGAYLNLQSWHVKADAGGWYQYMLTDGVVNKAFGDAKLKRQLEALQIIGCVVVDIAQLPFASKAVYEQLRKSVVEQGIKSKLPYLSDLARYAQLLAMGGLYVDVDVSPGQINMSEILTCAEGIPQLGPCFRTTKDAKLCGYFDPLESARILAVVLMYSKDMLNIGNHFIAAPARNVVVARANEIATTQVRKEGITLGGADFLKAFCSLDGFGPNAIQAALPSWAQDIEWVTPESDNMVN
jgi:Domain of unknown function (DUF4157)/Glycosyltransferase sugar-binding region containing DXD motif